MSSDELSAFEEEKRSNGLYADWEYDEDAEEYEISQSWWFTYRIYKLEDGWHVRECDHDAGANDDGSTYTACEDFDDQFINGFMPKSFSTWIEAAKAVQDHGVLSKRSDDAQ